MAGLEGSKWVSQAPCKRSSIMDHWGLCGVGNAVMSIRSSGITTTIRMFSMGTIVRTVSNSNRIRTMARPMEQTDCSHKTARITHRTQHKERQSVLKDDFFYGRLQDGSRCGSYRIGASFDQKSRRNRDVNSWSREAFAMFAKRSYHGCTLIVLWSPDYNYLPTYKKEKDKEKKF